MSLSQYKFMIQLFGDGYDERRKAVYKDALNAIIDDYALLPDSDVSKKIDTKRVNSPLLQQFSRYTWAARSKYTRAWLHSVIIFDLALIVFDWLMVPSLLLPSLCIRGGGVTLSLLIIYNLWGRYQSPALQGSTLVAVAVTIMMAAGILGNLGGPIVFERYLTAGLFTVSTAIMFFPVEARWTHLAISVAVTIFIGFMACEPTSDLTPSFLMIAFYSAAVLSLSLARQEAQDGLWKGFASRIREARDQKQLTRINAELSTAANVDPLTGIANRRSVTAHIEMLWQDETIPKSCIAFLMADIDHFKAYNDTFGHAAGDACIQAVSGAVQHDLRTGDIVSRHGGEEFLIILAPVTLDEALSIAERICRSVESLAIEHPKSVASNVVTISVGLALAQEGVNASSIVKIADAALYKAKERGRNQVALGLTAQSSATGSYDTFSKLPNSVVKTSHRP